MTIITHTFLLKKQFYNFAKMSSKLIKLNIKAYDMARKKFHIELNGTAASHNRILYFQNM